MEGHPIAVKQARSWVKPIVRLDPEHRVLLALVGLALVFGVIYALITPPFMGPDEGAHYQYVQSLWDSGGTKITGDASYHQPAYYWLEAPVYVLTRSQPKEIQSVAMRLVSVGLLLGQVMLAYLSAKLLFPTSPFVALGAAAMVALLPGRVWIGAMINDDNLVSLSSTAFIYFVLRSVLRDFEAKSILGMALLAVATLLSKRTAWAVVVVSAMALLLPAILRVWSAKASRRTLAIVATALGIGIVGTFILSFLFPGLGSRMSSLATTFLTVLDVATYGRARWALENWQRFLSVQPLAELSTLQFKSLWLPIWRDDYAPPDSAYSLALALMAAAGAGLLLRLLTGVISRGRKPIDEKRVFATVTLLAILLGAWGATAQVYLMDVVRAGSSAADRTVAWNAHARYLFPALVPFAYLVALGLGRLIPARMQPVGLAILIAILLYLFGVSIYGLLSTYYWWSL